MCGQMKLFMWFNLTISSNSVLSIYSLEFWVTALFVGPHILLAQVSGCVYFNFHWTSLEGLLEDVSLDMHLHMWFQHDIAPPHYSHEVHQWLSKYYPVCWMDVKFQFPDLHTHLNLMLLSVGIFENQGLCQWGRY
jgi:hypothetical protein